MIDRMKGIHTEMVDLAAEGGPIVRQRFCVGLKGTLTRACAAFMFRRCEFRLIAASHARCLRYGNSKLLNNALWPRKKAY